jgi:hypothetical protein
MAIIEYRHWRRADISFKALSGFVGALWHALMKVGGRSEEHANIVVDAIRVTDLREKRYSKTDTIQAFFFVREYMLFAFL